MYAQAIGTSTTIRKTKVPRTATPRNGEFVLWERSARPDFTGRLLNVYRASGRPA